jgi:hypothetical protein
MRVAAQVTIVMPDGTTYDYAPGEAQVQLVDTVVEDKNTKKKSPVRYFNIVAPVVP